MEEFVVMVLRYMKRHCLDVDMRVSGDDNDDKNKFILIEVMKHVVPHTHCMCECMLNYDIFLYSCLFALLFF